MGVLPHLGEDAARYLPEGDFRIVVWSTPVWLVQNGRWREWWRGAKETGFPPEFVVDVDAVLAKKAKVYSEASVAVNKDSHDS